MTTLRCTACVSSAHGVAPARVRELGREVRGVGPPAFTEEVLLAGGLREPLPERLERPLVLKARRSATALTVASFVR
jgi:hypothetical protein